MLKFRKYNLYFFTLFLTLFFVDTIFFGLFYVSRKNSKIDFEKENEANKVKIEEKYIHTLISDLISDLLYLANLTEADLLKNSPYSQLENKYLHYANYKKNYDQIRLLNEDGEELVKIIHKDSVSVIAPQELLENKHHRRYFKAVENASFDEIYISEFTLYDEDFSTEKPILRLAKKVKDSKGKTNYIILNYEAKALIEDIQSVSNLYISDTILLNQDSSWIFSSSEYKKWGYLFLRIHNQCFDTQEPKLWKRMSGSFSGQFQDAEKIVTFDTIEFNDIFGQKVSYVNQDNGVYWKIVSILPIEKLFIPKKDIIVYYFTTVFLILIYAVLRVKLKLNKDDNNKQRMELEKKESVIAMIVTANHEINQPLTVAKGYTELLRKHSSYSTTENYISQIQASLERIDMILRKFRNSDKFNYADYYKDTKMILFDDKENMNKPPF